MGRYRYSIKEMLTATLPELQLNEDSTKGNALFPNRVRIN